MKRTARILSTTLAGGCVLVLLLAAVGAAWQWSRARADAARHPPRGQRVAVGGVHMHLDCRGSGRPLLLLEAGLMSGSSTWMRVHDALARTTETCTYDRIGIGWSDAADAPRTPAAVAARLHALIDRAGKRAPYVLVGMSAGGVFVREYYQQFPQDVVGMVLVDSSHEQQLAHLPRDDQAEAGIRLLAACTWVQPLGLVRLLDAMAGSVETAPPDPATGPLPAADAVPALIATMNRSDACAGLHAETGAFLDALATAPELRDLGSLPLLVLSQDTARPLDPALLADAALASREHAQRRAWDRLQQALAAASTRGRRKVIAGSGHLIQHDRPQAMIDAVTAFVVTLRNDSDRVHANGSVLPH